MILHQSSVRVLYHLKVLFATPQLWVVDERAVVLAPGKHRCVHDGGGCWPCEALLSQNGVTLPAINGKGLTRLDIDFLWGHLSCSPVQLGPGEQSQPFRYRLILRSTSNPFGYRRCILITLPARTSSKVKAKV